MGHKYPPPPPLLVTSTLPGGDTAPAQLPLDVSQWLLGHVLCPVAQLHPKPILLSLSHHTPMALQAVNLSKGVRCQTSGRCLTGISSPVGTSAPSLALPWELRI